MLSLPETEQEVFDLVAKHLLTQNKRSDNVIGCCYRSRNGLKCAAGCLIPDESYNKSMETYGWPDLVKRQLVSAKHETLISRLQVIHDRAAVSEWKQKLKAIAEQHNLEFKFDNFTVPGEKS
jgi:hypothetical protein